jgi:quinol monooxygenase YgiN
MRYTRRDSSATGRRNAMHMQVVTFQLKDMTDAEFRAFCDEVAPAFAGLPGLVAKVWLADPATGTYGGVYTWENRAAYEAYTQSDLFNAVATNPKFTGIPRAISP